MRLIDADNLIEELEKKCCAFCRGSKWEDCAFCGYGECLETIRNAETISTAKDFKVNGEDDDK